MREAKGTPEAIAYAKLLREQGLSYAEIGRRLGVTGSAIRMWTDDDWGRERREAVNARRRGVSYYRLGVSGWVDPDGERKKPTLAYVPGIEGGRTYCTAVIRLRKPKAPHAALKKPRTLFAYPLPKRLVHLGGGKVLFE